MESPLLQNRKFLFALIIIGAIVLLASGGALWSFTRPASVTPTPAPTFAVPPELELTPPPSLEELATRYPQLAELLQDPSLDSVYKDFMLAYQTGGIEAARELALQRGLLNDKDEVRITLVVDDEKNAATVASELEQFGLIVEGTYRDLVDIAVPMRVIEQFAKTEDPAKLFEQLGQLKHVIKLRLPIPSRTGKCGALAGCLAPESKVEGIEVTGAKEWHDAGFTGQGVKVGVLDLGFDGYRDLLGKELPETVTVESFARGREADSSGEVHGAACAEIVHAMAPDAELYFAYYDGSEVGLGRAVDWLLEQGVQIISHSATGLVAPMDGSGSQAKLVEEVVGKGVIWVNASGNYAQEHYRAEFTDSDGNNQHEFPNGKELMTYYPPSNDAVIVLNWNDWPDSQTDLDLFLYDKDSDLVASSQNLQSGEHGDYPFEGIRLREPEEKVYYLVIQAKTIDRSITLDVYAPDAEIEFNSAAYSLGTPADAAGGLTVGAIEWKSSRLEQFSSQGPTNDDRLKPELTAPDRVTTASYAPRSFPGTSASTPHVAGAAALVLSAFPDYTPQEVKDYLIGNAADLGPSGSDAAYGYGRLQLPKPEAGRAAPPTPVEIPPTPVAAAPAPITPLPPVAKVTGDNASLAILACLGVFMCMGALALFGGVALLLVLARPKRRYVPVQYAPPPSPPPVEEACLITAEGARSLLQQGETTVGRSHENVIALDQDNQVSRQHAVIYWDGRQCTVTDLGSSNGTFVNGQRLAPHTPTPLQSGDRVRFGPEAKFIVRLPLG